MRLRHISIFFIVGIALINLFTSCNDSETESISTSLSADAQIYSFSARSIPRTHADTINFPHLAKVKFAIDQADRVIYNVDSLPYGFTVRKLAASIGFSSSTPNAKQVVYPNDSIVDWASATDSIDFMIYPKRDPSLNGVPQVKFKVTAQNGTSPYNYTIKLLIHKVDPDSITWRRQQDFPIAGDNKVLLVNNTFYSYINNSGTLALYKSSKATVSWSSTPLSGLPATALNSIVEAGGVFYATDGTNVLKSSDGASWSTAFAYAGQIVGVLPKVETGADPCVLFVKKSGTDVYLEYSNGNVNAIAESIKVSAKFPVEGYSVVYDQNNRMLLITGGKNIGGTWNNSTWYVENRGGKLNVSPENNKPIPFVVSGDLVSFLYNNKLCVWAKGKEAVAFKLYSSDRGLNWVEMPSKQYFAPTAEKVVGQTILVDNDNYIWTFGGGLTSTTFSKEVWRGRMNKLNK